MTPEEGRATAAGAPDLRVRGPEAGTAAGDRGPLDEVLVPLRRSALRDSAVRWALLAVAGWAGAVSLLLAWSKLSPTGHVALIVAGLGGPAVLLAAGAWAVRRPSVVEVARVADARLDLRERLASALFYAGAPGEMEARLRADAIGVASKYRPAQAFPLRRHRELVAIALTVVLVAVVLAVTPNPQAAVLARRAADRAATAQARQVVASARQQLGSPSSPEAQKISAALQAALSQLAKAGTPLASLVALSNLARQLGQLDNSIGEAAQAADAAAGDALATAPGAQDVASDLANGNLKAAAAGLQSLSAKLSTLSPADRQALAAALAKAAGTAGYQGGTGLQGSSGSATNQAFAGGLAQASSALSAGHLGQASQALKSAAAGAAAAAAAVSVQQQLAVDQAAVQNEEAKVASQAQADSGGGAKPEPRPGRAGSANGGGLAPSANSAASGQRGAGPGPGASGGNPGSSGQGAGSGGQGAGNAGGGPGSGGSGGGGSAGTGSGGTAGSGPGGKGQGGEGGPGRAKGPQTGASGSKASESPSDQVFIGGQPGEQAQVVGAQAGAGGAVKTTPYQAVLPSFEKTALQDLGSRVVSPDDQGIVRNYFSSLGSGR